MARVQFSRLSDADRTPFDGLAIYSTYTFGQPTQASERILPPREGFDPPA